MNKHFPYRFGGVLLLMLLCGMELFGQTASKLISYRCKATELSKAFNDIERLSGYYHIQYSYKSVSGLKSSVDVDNATVPVIVNRLISGKGLESSVKGQFIYITKAKEAHSQRKLFSGVVLDTNGLPLRGAVVRNLANGKNAVADVDGKFHLDYGSESDNIVVTFLGMKEVRFHPHEDKFQRVYLEEDDHSLADVVVTGYQTLKRHNVTGSYGFVNGKKTQ